MFLDLKGSLPKRSTEVWFLTKVFVGGVNAGPPNIFLFTPLILGHFRKNNDNIMTIIFFCQGGGLPIYYGIREGGV